MSNQPYFPGNPPAFNQSMPQLPKKRKAWPWIVGGIVAMFVLCGFGSMALIGGGAKAVKTSIDQQAVEHKAAIKVTSCDLDAQGIADVSYTVKNDTSDEQTYIPQFDIEDGKGTVYGQASDIVNSLAPGKSYIGKAVGTFTGGGSDLRCVLKDA